MDSVVEDEADEVVDEEVVVTVVDEEVGEVSSTLHEGDILAHITQTLGGGRGKSSSFNARAQHR